MVTSNYMPDVSVQIAWDGGFRVPMADWTWTDVSGYAELAEGIAITGGRADERSTADANTLTLTLDNSDGRFTAGRITSPYYPNVKLYRPIRVLATPVDGVQSVRFTGYVTSWPVQWDDTEAYAKVTVSASSRLARLGLNTQWRSLVEETYLFDSPVAYYPLGEPEGSTKAADVSGLGAAPLTIAGSGAAVVFGQATGPGTDDLTAATFAGGEYLRGAPGLTSPASLWAEAFFLATGSGNLVDIRTTTDALRIWVNGTNITVWADTPGSSIVQINGPNVVDGAVHHALAQATWGGTLELFLDGVSVGSIAAPAASFTPSDIVVGEAFAGSIAHVAFGTSALASARVLAHATAGLTAWAGELTDARFIRYAAMAGIPAAEVNAEPGSTTMVHVDTTGQNIIDLLRLVETTEAGVMFDDRDGSLTMHGRGHRYAAASVLTLDMAKHEIESDYSPRLDPTGLANDITATGVMSAHVVDLDSIDAHGVAAVSIATASEDDDEPLNLASWTKYKYAEPKPRVPSLSVDATAQAVSYAAGNTTVKCADLLAVTIGDRSTVANHPQQAALSITDYFVEGWTETYGPESLTITWNVSPTDAEDNVLILDDPVRGNLDEFVLGL